MNFRQVSIDSPSQIFCPKIVCGEIEPQSWVNFQKFVRSKLRKPFIWLLTCPAERISLYDFDHLALLSSPSRRTEIPLFRPSKCYPALWNVSESDLFHHSKKFPTRIFHISWMKPCGTKISSVNKYFLSSSRLSSINFARSPDLDFEVNTLVQPLLNPPNVNQLQ